MSKVCSALFQLVWLHFILLLRYQGFFFPPKERKKECGFKCSGKSQVQAPRRRQEHLCLVLGRSQGRNVLASEGARGQTARLIHKEGALTEEKRNSKVRSLGPRAPGQEGSTE